MKHRIAIVDPFFSGACFPAIANQMGYEVIAIESNAKTKAPPPKDPFPFHFIFDGNISILAEKLKNLSVKALFAGCENGVLLADSLSEKLGLITNGTSLSLARRDKGIMKKIFQQHGVPCAEFQEFEQPSLPLILEWIEWTRQNYPIVLKPAAAFGSINVFICNDFQELQLAVKALDNQDLSSFGVLEKKILAEGFIDGEEYCINILGDGKNHFITDVWKYERKEFVKGRNAYYSTTLLDPKDKSIPFDEMVEASIKAVSALQINHGCSHVEVKIDSKSKVKILEVGARISGGNLARHAKAVTGQNIEKGHIQTFLGEAVDFSPIYSLQGYTALAMLKTDQCGKIISFGGIDAIKSLPSFKEITLHYQIGDFIKPTVDFAQRPGSVVLQAMDQLQVKKDTHRCHELFSINVSQD